MNSPSKGEGAATTAPDSAGWKGAVWPTPTAGPGRDRWGRDGDADEPAVVADCCDTGRGPDMRPPDHGWGDTPFTTSIKVAHHLKSVKRH